MTAANDEAQRVRGYLISQANKLSLPDLVAKVRADGQPLYEAAAAIPPARFHERPAAEDWSAAEVCAHVLDMTETGRRAIAGILDNGALPPRIRDEIRAGGRDDARGAGDFWRIYQQHREQLYERVLRAAGDEHLNVKITHSTFGAFSWREWLLFMRVHDLDHLRQLQQIAQAFSS